VGELCNRQLAAGEIRPERAFAVVAMTVTALRGGAVPKGLAGLGVAALGIGETKAEWNRE